jgi:hypothetical protein
VNRRKNPTRIKRAAKCLRSTVSAALRVNTGLTMLVLCVLPALAQSAPNITAPTAQTGRIRGMILDKDGAEIPHVTVTLVPAGANASTQTLSGDDGSFTFTNVPAGPFQLIFACSGFASSQTSGILRPGEDQLIAQVTLAVGSTEEDIKVTVTPEEIATDQVHVEEKQRLLGVIPNFYVTYDPQPAPLTTRLKFELAWKSTIDPVSFGITGIIAGFEQADNTFAGYGQGAQGYGKRFGAAFADSVTGTFIGGAILPSLLKQDPRYFYKGTGTVKERTLYAMANAFICKGDNGRWQPNYSSVGGNLASAGISNLYYPAADRNGPGLTFENAFIGIGANAFSNIIQEFLLRRFTPHARDRESAKP